VADTTHNGYLSSADWNTFNGKQAAGNYITALTGDVTASGPGSVAATLATVNSNVGSFGSSTSIPSFTVNGKGLITAASGNVVVAPAGTLTGTTLASNVVTSSLTSLGIQAQALNMGAHLINAVTDPVSAQDAATKNYVDTVASGLQPIQGVQAATAGSNISGTYSNGAAGIGATFTTTSTATFVVDGFTFTTLGQRILLKDQSSGFQNGVYSVTQLATGILPTILTRTLDYDTASDMDAGTLIPVINGTVNAQTSWLQTATITTVGTDSLVFVQWTANPANYLLKANNLSDVASKSTSFNNLSPMTTLGDIIYENATPSGSRLAGNTTSTKNFLTQTGTGSVSAAPAWGTIQLSDLPGGGTAFFQASSQVTTASSAISSGSFTTFSNSPALSFTPTVSGTYKVYCSIPINMTSAGAVSLERIFNTTGSATLLDESQGTSYPGGTPPTRMSVFVQSVYTLTSGTAYVFDIQGLVIGGSGGNVQNSGNEAPFYMFAEQVAVGTAANLVLGAFGSSPNGNAGTISASTLTLQPASASFPGGVSTTTQTFAGSKNFTSPIGYNNTTPASNTSLDIINTTGATQRIVQTGYGGQVGLRGRYANGTLGSPTAATNGNILEFMSGMGYGTDTFPSSSSGAVNIVAGETFTDTSNATYIQFSVTPTGSVTTAEAARVNSTGNVLIGTTTDSGTQKLQVNGNSNVGTVTGGTWNGVVTAGSSVLTTGTTYTTPSNITTATLFKFILVGGGGGGGGSISTSTHGSGGGGSAAVIVYAVGLSPSTGYTYAIGAAGSGGISSTTAATAGGATTISLDSITYSAGGGGLGAPSTSGSGTAGGAGGTATNTFGTGFSTSGLNVPGQAGAFINGASATVPSGWGGNSGMGYGMGGQSNPVAVTSSTAQAGSGYGGGGSGGIGATSTGGAGTGGFMIVEWQN
jgi:hypothetical protein